MNNEPATGNVLLPLGTMSAMLGVTAKWLRTEAQAGRLPCLDAGGRLLFDEDTVRQLLMDRARTAVSRAIEDAHGDAEGNSDEEGGAA